MSTNVHESLKFASSLDVQARDRDPRFLELGTRAGERRTFATLCFLMYELCHEDNFLLLSDCESHENLLISGAGGGCERRGGGKRSSRPYWWNGDNFAPR